MTTTSLGAIAQQIIAAAKNDALKVGLPVVQAFLNDIIANPSQSNIVAQAAALEVNLLAALPNFEAALAKDLASIIQTEVNALVAAPATAAPAPAAA